MYKRCVFVVFALLATFALTPSAATSASTRTSLTFERDPVLSITASSIAELVNPAKNTLLTPATTVTVSTNNETGYTLTMSDPSGNSLSDAEISTSSDPTTYIASIASATTISSVSDLAANHWAWNKINTSANPTSATRNSDTTAYNPLPTSNSSATDNITLTETTAQAQSSQTSVTFAINLDNHLPAGTYSDVVYFSVIANPANFDDPARFYSLTSMQGMTANICNSVKTPSNSATTTVDNLTDYEAVADKTTVVPELHLRDLRDDQVYTVRKLADGNCWMTENLRYGANTDGSANTDLATASNITSDNTDNPAANFSVPLIDEGANGFPGWGGSFDVPRININNANTISEDDGGTKYGALYNYCAATAGKICTENDATSALDNGKIGGSICPAGWTIPTHTGADRDFQNVLSLYNITTASAPHETPLNYVTAGYISTTSILGRSNPGNSINWSATLNQNDDRKAVSFYFSASGIHRDAYSRAYGGSLRCVAS